MRKEFRAKVYGRVQMVMYRDFAQRKAKALGIVGTVKNLTDGTVEIFAQGEEEKLKKYIQKLRRGSLFAKVEKVEAVWQEPSGRYEGFAITY